MCGSLMWFGPQSGEAWVCLCICMCKCDWNAMMKKISVRSFVYKNLINLSVFHEPMEHNSIYSLGKSPLCLSP